MAQLVLPPSCNPIPNPPPWNHRPKKRKRPEDDDDGGGKRHRNPNPNPNPPLPPATATAPAPTTPPPCSNSNQFLSSSSCSSGDPYVIALRQFGMHLPSGYYFKPTMDELVGHYLLRKINGTLSPIAMALIPECDVYGDEEPWEIWSRFGAADDHSLFLFSPLKKKKKSSSNGTVIARRIGSEGGTWHEDSKKRRPVDGMILKAVERQFSYRNLNSPKKRKFPWLLKEFTLDNYTGGNYAVCELRKTGCNSAVCPPDSHYAPLPCHLLSSTTENEMMMTTPDGSSPPPDSLPPSSTTETELVEDSEYAAELDRILDLIDFSGCEDEEIPSSPPQSQVEIDVESDFLLPGKDDGFINIEHYNVESLGEEAEFLVYDGDLTSSNDLEPAPTKPDDMEIKSGCEQPPIHMVPFDSIVPDKDSFLC
ncbi:hypothetical protein Tsubulata_044625 [Turnera subulata]|uniref:NAC domain-containing protein n=1 Tax=Turnera subulata TaxID=218843 RepID=A0A9Q0GK61_9ROSI|nr:hypothetical protein Tsubulata_044625 [Turnera subulata]